MGLLTCCFGLCSGIFTLIYNTFFAAKVSAFLGFLTIVIPSAGLLFGVVFCNYLTAYAKTYGNEVSFIDIF